MWAWSPARPKDNFDLNIKKATEHTDEQLVVPRGTLQHENTKLLKRQKFTVTYLVQMIDTYEILRQYAVDATVEFLIWR